MAKGKGKGKATDAAKEKKGRVELPGLKKLRPLTIAVPEGYDHAKHKPLKKKDFEKEALFLRFKADEAAHRARTWTEKSDRYNADAETSERLGSPEERKLHKKFESAKKRMDDLKKQLEAQGINVEELETLATS